VTGPFLPAVSVTGPYYYADAMISFQYAAANLNISTRSVDNRPSYMIYTRDIFEIRETHINLIDKTDDVD
jgi:hypothetical protein